MFHYVFATIVITFGASFQFGYQTGVINAPLDLLTDFVDNVIANRSQTASNSFSTAMTTLMVAGFPIGGIFGAVVGSLMSKKVGRKLSLFIMNVPMAIGSLLIMASKIAVTFEMIIVGRILIGLACGAFSAVAPVYLAEIAPIKIRGISGITHQLAIVTAILISQIFGLPKVLGTADLWPYLLGFTILPSVTLFLLLWICPESPRYLLLNNLDAVGARTSLKWYRQKNSTIDEEMDEMLIEQSNSDATQLFTICDLIHNRPLRTALMISIVAHLAQQFSGINAALFYSSKLFTYMNFSEDEVDYYTLGVGLAIVMVTVISIFMVEHCGRRPLLLYGLTVMLFSAIVITVSLALRSVYTPLIYLAMVAVYLFVCGFAIGPGSIPWFIVAEMFVQETRDAAVTITVLVNWIGQITIAVGYVYLMAYLKDYSFVPFIVLLTIFIGLLYKYLPETKGRTPFDVQQEFINKSMKIPKDSSDFDEDSKHTANIDGDSLQTL